MTLSLYHATVPVFTHYLRCLRQTLSCAQAHAAQNAMPAGDLLGARLADGMFTLSQQVGSACGFSMRACCPLFKMEVPDHSPAAGEAASFDGLQRQIDRTLDFLGGLPEAGWAAAEEAQIVTRAGFADRQFTGRAYVLEYAVPNFFFHLTMVHAILRHRGVPIGKQDFDGHHGYPEGFSFPAPNGAASAGG